MKSEHFESEPECFFFITGASTGIGKACAIELDRRGFRVFAGVRSDEAAQRLRAEASDRLTPVRIDVTEDAELGSRAFVLETPSGMLRSDEPRC